MKKLFIISILISYAFSVSAFQFIDENAFTSSKISRFFSKIWECKWRISCYSKLGSFTTLNSSDNISTFPTTYNANLTKTIEVGTTSVASITTLANLVSVGTITSGTWGGSLSITSGTSSVLGFTARDVMLLDVTLRTLMATDTLILPVSASSTITKSGEIEVDTNDRALHFNSGGTTYSRPATTSITLAKASSTASEEIGGFFMPYDFVVSRVLTRNDILSTTTQATTTGYDFNIWHGTDKLNSASVFTRVKNTTSTSTWTIHAANLNDTTIGIGEMVWVQMYAASSTLHKPIIQLDGFIQP